MRARRALRRRYGKSMGGNPTGEQNGIAESVLKHYGARLTEDGHIARGDKVLGVRLEVRKGRLRMLAPSGDVLATYPAGRIATGVADFVEKFWYWKPVSS